MSLSEFDTYLGAVGVAVALGIAFLFALLGLMMQRKRMKAHQSAMRDEWDREWQQRWQQLQAEHTEQLHRKALEAERLRAELGAASRSVDTLTAELSELRRIKERFIQTETRLQESQHSYEKEQQLLAETRTQLFKEFELAANRLFEAKQQQFSVSSKHNMEAVLNPFKEQLKDFNKRVEDIYHKENSQRNQLVGQIAELQKQAQQISSDANNLAAALKGDNKAQGNWGEIILERLLEQSGLENGREYETQKSHLDSSGKRLKPDVIVHLPEGKDIVIDAKVSLVDYQRFCDLDDVTEKEAALKRHVDSVRTHIRTLSLKQYENLEGVRTLDFVFVFMPVEAAYVAAIQAAPALFKEAYDKNIVLVSPSSLMVALRTVETLWRYEKQNSNAEAIAQSAGRLYDQFVMLVAALDDMGGYLDKATKSYDLTRRRLSEGRGNLIRRVEALRDLGAKTSKLLPEKLRADALESSDEQDSEEEGCKELGSEEQGRDAWDNTELDSVAVKPPVSSPQPPESGGEQSARPLPDPQASSQLKTAAAAANAGGADVRLDNLDLFATGDKR